MERIYYVKINVHTNPKVIKRFLVPLILLCCWYLKSTIANKKHFPGNYLKIEIKNRNKSGDSSMSKFIFI